MEGQQHDNEEGPKKGRLAARLRSAFERRRPSAVKVDTGVEKERRNEPRTPRQAVSPDTLQGETLKQDMRRGSGAPGQAAGGLPGALASILADRDQCVLQISHQHSCAWMYHCLSITSK